MMRAGPGGVGSKLAREKTARKRDKKGFCDIFTPLFVQPTPQGSGLEMIDPVVGEMIDPVVGEVVCCL